MIRLLIALGILVCWHPFAHSEPVLGPGDHTRAIVSDGMRRSYLLHIPPSYDPAKPTPVLLAFHGGGGNAKRMVSFSGLNEKSDQAGFIVVYPSGAGRLPSLLTFNAGNCCGYAMHKKIDDVAFTRRILNELETLLNIDPKRIYATGMSNGGMMTYRLASELADRIAAIAPVAGTMGLTKIHAKRPVPIIHFHGTADENLPLGGGVGKGVSGTDFISVEYSIRAWVNANGCKEEPIVEALPDKAADGTRVIRKVYAGGRQGSEVILILIEGGGHTWPGQNEHPKKLGISTRDISANDMMWDFFLKHPMP